MNIYLSYNNKYNDIQIGTFIANNLSTQNFQILNDNENLKLGEHWKNRIIDSINKCTVFISIVDNDDPFLMFELGYALAKNKKIILIADSNNFANKLPVELNNMLFIEKTSDLFEILIQIEKYTSTYKVDLIYSNIDSWSASTIIEKINENLDIIDNFDSIEFENMLEKWFQEHSFTTQKTSSTIDFGYDFKIDTFLNSPAVVEVKKYKRTSQVPLASIRQLIGSMALEHAEYGIMISTAPYSNSSKYFINSIEQKIYLLTIEDIIKLNKLDKLDIESYCNDLKISNQDHYA